MVGIKIYFPAYEKIKYIDVGKIIIIVMGMSIMIVLKLMMLTEILKKTWN